VDGHVVTVFGPGDGFGYIRVLVTLGLVAVDVQFHLYLLLGLYSSFIRTLHTRIVRHIGRMAHL
jgi:hypothetical protein